MKSRPLIKWNKNSLIPTLLKFRVIPSSDFFFVFFAQVTEPLLWCTYVMRLRIDLEKHLHLEEWLYYLKSRLPSRCNGLQRHSRLLDNGFLMLACNCAFCSIPLVIHVLESVSSHFRRMYGLFEQKKENSRVQMEKVVVIVMIHRKAFSQWVHPRYIDKNWSGPFAQVPATLPF